MEGRISFANSGPGQARIVIECHGDPEEIERANMHVTPRLGDAVGSLTQWIVRRSFFVEIRDSDGLTALQATVRVLDVLRTNGLLNLSNISG